MVFPWRLMGAAAIVTAYLTTSRKQGAGALSFLGAFCGWCFVQFLGWLVWKVFLYPHFFSSLRGLPEPGGNSWWNGQYTAIAKNNTGVPQLGW